MEKKMRTLLLALLCSLPLTVNGAQREAIFAGGCFWCVEEAFEKVKGVQSAISGFSGGKSLNPTYEEVSRGGTGHIESVKVTFDSDQVSYEELLTVFWKNIDPFDAKGQFCDKGDSYLSGIFYLSAEQEKLAQKSLEEVEKKFPEKKVVTFVRPGGEFYSADAGHQDYSQKNPLKYKFYKYSCGREKRLKEIWNKR